MSKMGYRLTGFSVAGLLVALSLVLTVTAGSRPTASAGETDEFPAPVSTTLEGYVKGIAPDKWLIGTTKVLVDERTLIVEKRGKAEVGAWAIVWATQDNAGGLYAELIHVDRPAGASGPVLQLSGVLGKQLDRYWVIDQTPVMITDETMITGSPQVGWLVWAAAEQIENDLRAIAIEAVADAPAALPVEFEGPLEGLTGDTWRLGGTEFRVDPDAVVIGEMAVGRTAEVRASYASDGTLLAHVIRIVDTSIEARVSAMVASIQAEDDGDQKWDVIIFPKKPWADPTRSTLLVDSNTVVDESRAVAQAGLWAEVQGVSIDANEIQAEVVRLDQPVPVNMTGMLHQVEDGATQSWWRLAGQPVWVTPANTASAAALSSGTVEIRGVRLGNGVIWVEEIRPVDDPQ